MLFPRLIPCLLIHNSGLVKTKQFKEPKYVGDPINAVRIFNEKNADEIIILDIDATVQKNIPNYNFIAKLANEARMPLSYGGGVSTTEQVEQIIRLGVEKVAISAAAIDSTELISSAVARVGSQSIIAAIDVKKTGLRRKYEVVTHNGKVRTGLTPIELAKKLQDLGVGEILLNCVDMDGMMGGYDMELIAKVQEQIHVPMTVSGGAGCADDISKLWKSQGLIGAAAGSLFVFKGKYKAVLINYPGNAEKASILKQADWSE
jgi:imidazole glycerol-phosphate synthase subunit HisF